MSYIGREPQVGNFQVCDAISVVNGQAAYTMQVSSVNVSPETANHMLVSLNGVLQAPISSYTVSGSTITFASNLVTGDVIDFIQILGSVLDLGTPSDGTVTSAKITYPLTTFSSTGIDDNATSTAITIDSSENVGIGTTSPTAILELFKAGTTQIKNAYSSTKYSLFGRTGGNYYWSAYEGGAALIFSTSASDDATTERMRIDSSGRLLVGTAAPFSSGNNSSIHINVDGVATAAGAIMSECSGTGTVFHYHLRNGNGGVGGISTNGSATAFVTSSDYRLKENVSYNFDATTRLKQLKPARFNFISDADITVDGFIAHEVSSVVPEAIIGTKDATETYTDDNGDEQTRPDYQAIDQSKLVPLLVKTIQELEARITTLENA